MMLLKRVTPGFKSSQSGSRGHVLTTVHSATYHGGLNDQEQANKTFTAEIHGTPFSSKFSDMYRNMQTETSTRKQKK